MSARWCSFCEMALSPAEIATCKRRTCPVAKAKSAARPGPVCPDCGGRKGKRSSARCQACAHALQKAQAKARPVCTECSKPRDPSGRTGLCHSCYRAQFDEARRHCSCGAPIRSKNVTGLCLPCWRLTYLGYVELRPKRPEKPPRPVPPPFLAERTLNLAVELFDVPLKDLTGKSNYTCHTRPRHAVAAALREHGLSYPAIARRVGMKHHTSAMSGVTRARAIAAVDPVYAAKLAQLMAVA